jgi:16S rRNA (guanine1207-N2)-methyltransferase
MADINRIALDYAVKNAKLNHVAVTPIHSNCFANIAENFDNIVLNPPIHAGKEVMYNMYKGSAAHLNPGGALYIVIHKKHGAESTIKKLAEIFTRVEVLYKKKGCFVVKSNM